MLKRFVCLPVIMAHNLQCVFLQIELSNAVDFALKYAEDGIIRCDDQLSILLAYTLPSVCSPNGQSDALSALRYEEESRIR